MGSARWRRTDVRREVVRGRCVGAPLRRIAELGEVARRLARSRIPRRGPAEMQRLLGPGDRDVGEAALLVLLAVAQRPAVWEASLLCSGDPDVVELEALGPVNGAERDGTVGEGARVRGERQLGEEV